MSRPPRFFILPEQVQGSRVTITGDDLRHIRTVLRKGPGDHLTLLDGRGMEYAVTIEGSSRDALVAVIVEHRRREIAGPRITLGQGIAKADRMDWIVQKATELGVSSIAPLVLERTIVKVRDEEKRVGRWRKICREAAMQCGRPDIPQVQGLRSLGEFLEDPAAAEVLRLMPWEEGGEHIRQVLSGHPAAQDIVVLIGPEGGISLSEARDAQDRGFRTVSLGPTILRTETAAIAALSMLSYAYRS